MTKDTVMERVGEIAELAEDDENAHKMEDRLREDVLRAIADGSCADPRGCAAEALKSGQIIFSRWCA